MNETRPGWDEIKAYYGRVLGSTRDLKTNACRCTETLPPSHREILAGIDAEILDRFYGCGSPIPPALEGCVVLDLGCGTGRDVYLASALVGPIGSVIGVDMTPEPLAVARRHQCAEADRLGFGESNVRFLQGYIEDLASLGIPDGSVDVVVSNCTLNLSPRKDQAFSEIFRVLKPGGELFFSDVFASRRLPQALQEDPLLRGECLGGAMYVEDFRRLMGNTGWSDYRIVSRSGIALGNSDIEAKVGPTTFWSMKIRAFKLESLEDICEDYGQVAVYLGTIPDHPNHFPLDDHHTFVTGKPMLVCGNTAAMVSETRLGRHFKVIGDRSTHFGAFNCSTPGIAPICEAGCS